MTHLEEHSLPYMDKALPDAWKAATTFASAISREAAQHGLSLAEGEIDRCSTGFRVC